jgi:hypothetical protein
MSASDVGVYSETAASLYGSEIWEVPGGGEVYVTKVLGAHELGTYKWADAYVVGPVVRKLRDGGRSPRVLQFGRRLNPR